MKRGMTLITALILGLVQGLTEFFPVSSSAHLKLTEMLLGAKHVPVIFSLACHLGTLIAMLWFFKAELIRLVKRDRKKLAYLIVALFPLIPSYFLLSKVRELASKPELLGLFLMVTGGILLVGGKFRFKKKRGLVHDVLMIGAMQSAALIPGISRSASTISCAHVLGWDAKDAVRFSFLLAIPTIMGGNLMEVQKLWKEGQMNQLMNLECLVGFVTSLVVGMVMIRFAIQWLEKGKLKHFAWYCLMAGTAANVYFFGIR